MQRIIFVFNTTFIENYYNEIIMRLTSECLNDLLIIMHQCDDHSVIFVSNVH